MMFVVISAVRFDQVGFVIVGGLMQITIGLEETGPVKRLTRVVGDDEFNIRLVKVTQFRRKRMANVLVGDHDVGRDAIAGGDFEAISVYRRDEFLVSGTR